MADPEVTNSCIICNKPNASRCARCNGAFYCSKTCQRGDYPTHKLLCSRFAGFDMTTRPTEEHVRAILFPVDKARPEIIWLQCEWSDSEEFYDTKWQYPNTKSFFHDEYGQQYHIQHNHVLARQPSNPVYISYRDAFLVDGSAPNKSIREVLSQIPGYRHDWRGIIIAYGKAGPLPDPQKCRDIDMNDFRHVIDHLASYNSDRVPSVPFLFPGELKVKGVKINCAGDQKMFNKPPFEEIELSTTHNIFEEHDTSDIADRIGLPIFTRRCHPHPNWANDRTMYNNQYATYLHLCCDPKAEFDLSRGILGWGWVSTDWMNIVGSTIVVRQDKKPLSPFHVEALCRYCFHDVGGYMAHSHGVYEPDEPMSKDLVLSIICRPTFSVCWSKIVDEKNEKGETVDVPSPYLV